jgi:hypothetical protein
VAAVLAGCSATTDPSGDERGSGGGGGASATSSSSSGGELGAGGESLSVGGAGGGATVEGEVFAHSGDTLWKLDPVSKAVTVVGSLSSCNDSVLDIAIDEDGTIFGATSGGLYRIDSATAQCIFVTSGSYPNSLSFVPKGTLDPDEEALVGYDGETYTRIDKTTGAKTAVGSLGDGYRSSGDVVSVINGGTYLTVKGNGCNDCIVQVDPATGALQRSIGALGHTNVFGLAFWGGSAYGFSDSGELFEVDLTTAAATSIEMPDAPPELSFFGAGSTTAAPLVQPQ